LGVALFVLLLTNVTTFGRGIREQPLIADVIATINADPIAEIADTQPCGLEIADFPDLPIHDSGIHIHEHVRYGFITDIRYPAGKVNIVLIVGAYQLLADLLEKLRKPVIYHLFKFLDLGTRQVCHI
jgi:hypothetical protein